jgi:hypothetical protein
LRADSFSPGALYTPDATNHLSLAGYWYVLVALPIFQFLLLRWIYRMFNWSLFLWKASRLDLRLSAARPDAAGGLGFLGKSPIPFGTITFALSTVVSGQSQAGSFSRAPCCNHSPWYLSRCCSSL